jgi:hypothetical protein
LRAPNEAATERRVISIKIENSPESRPQTGIGDADVVYESVAEGGITRFNTLWHSKLPEAVGPVRSARLVDTWVVPQYQGLFVYSGSSSSVARALRAAKLTDLSEDAGVTYPFYRSTRHYAPHNLFVRPKRVFEEAKRRGYEIVGSPKPLRFLKRSTESTITAKAVTIPFSTANRVRWAYDPVSKSYQRFNNGKPFTDAATGKQVRAKNVVVIWAKHTPSRRDKFGGVTYDIQLGGKGRAVVLHDGQQYAATWSADRNTPPTFTDPNGKQLRLAPGNTWFQVVNQPVNVTIE